MRKNSRAKNRRAESGTALKGARPGAANKRSMAKGLGPKGQKALKQAQQLAKAGDLDGAAKLYVQMGEHLEGEGQHGLATRAMLRAAKVLYRAERQPKAKKAVMTAISYASQVKQRKAAVLHFRELVQGLRAKGHEAFADEVEGEVKSAFGLQKIARKRGARRGNA